jgi:hypothetical protein
MNDLKTLLDLALTDGHGPDPARPVDPAADLARGRERLRRRQVTRFAGGTASLAACAAVAAWALTAGGGAGTPTPPPEAVDTPAASATAPSPGPSQELPRIELVTYEGEQAPGYRVAEVPAGWEVQGGDAFALTIAPHDAKDRNYQVFVGKLVVMLQSKDAGAPTQGKPVPVDGRPGRVHVEGDVQALTYQLDDGRWMVIQAPTKLGWTPEDIARFATGVKVLGHAEGGVG